MLTIGSMVWGVRDLPRAMAFWTAALGYRPREEPGDDWVVLIPEEGEGPQLALDLVTSVQPRRHHLDLYADDPDAEVERLLGLGATRVDWRYPEDPDFIVLADPDGNPFCVARRP